MSKSSIVITGGIGSGKSTVTAMLATLGAKVVDADAVSRSLTAAQGAALPKIRQRFGDAAIQANGAMDRTHMRTLIFKDKNAKNDLEHILHPIIKELTWQAYESAQGWVVVDVPLLVEGGSAGASSPMLGSWRSVVDEVWVVDCLETTQVARVQARSQLTHEQVVAIISQQAGRDERKAAADVVIFNESLDLPSLKTLVHQLADRFIIAS